MALRTIRIAMEGVTGRLGTNQHLIRSLLAIRREGGLPLQNGDRLMPEPVLVGRNPDKLAALAQAHGGLSWSDDAATTLTDKTIDIYFDVAATGGRLERALRAVAAGKHIYLEKPVANSSAEAMQIVRAAKAKGLKAAAVQDKVYLPGFHKLKKVRDSGFFGRILSARLESGWWVFDGELYPAQRSSWNYRKQDGGGLVLDMYPHWRYLTASLMGPIKAVSCRKLTQQKKRWDEAGKPFDVDVEDEVFATFEFESGAMAQVTTSWASRVKRDDLIQIQIDGTHGSAVAGGHKCFVQSLAATPRPAWNVEVPQQMDFDTQWQEVPEHEPFKNSYRHGWEQYLRHVAEGAPLRSTLLEGARDVQLTEACYQSDRERRWVDIAPLSE
ncbi:MAG: Gfo/Idh/MocA family oxidoreductase [Alphaproteobacteria bacterium]|nr:Gfo/Idh/MocA family oxidoreductase [Alphaproteobacteria bacterium]